MSLLKWIFSRTSQEEQAQYNKALSDEQYEVYKVRPSRGDSPLVGKPRSPLHEAKLRARGDGPSLQHTTEHGETLPVIHGDLFTRVICDHCMQSNIIPKLIIKRVSVRTGLGDRETVTYTRSRKCEVCGKSVIICDEVTL